MIKRDIQITWNPVAGTVNYHIFRKKTNGIITDFVDVATVADPLITYTFVGSDEDERDIYIVKALQADDITLVNDSNAEQTIFFPDRSAGIYTTDIITPDNQPMSVPIDVPYITKEDFITSPIAEGLGINVGTTMYNNGRLDRILLQASSQVNRYCRRYFQKQTIDETYPNVTIQVTNPRLTNIPLLNGPLIKINSVTIQVLKWFIPFTLEYEIPFYAQHYYNIVPLLSTAGSTGTPIPSVLLEQSQLGIIWTNYTCGYDIIPEDIKYATELIAGKMIGLGKHNPLGLARFKTQTTDQTFSKTKTENPIDDEVKSILDKYRYLTMRMT